MKLYKYRWPGVDAKGNSMPGPIGETYYAGEHRPRGSEPPPPGGPLPVKNSAEVAMINHGATWAFDGGGARREGMPYKHGMWKAVAAVKRVSSGAQVRDVWLVRAQCSCGRFHHFTASQWKCHPTFYCRKCAIARNSKKDATIAQNPGSGEYLTRPGSVKND